MPAGGREYDIILFGATGYTGMRTAEYMAANLPTDIRWAIAGRSLSKLESIAVTCKAMNPDRIQPEIEICNLDDAELGDLARKTTILITTVGPYSQHGEYAFKACAENGTHYLDCTGELPWVHKMIKKYEAAAKMTGAIMIPQIGVESAPADMLTWTLVSLIRSNLSVPTGQVILSLHDFHALPSGGTLASVFAIFDYFTVSELVASFVPYALSPIPGPQRKSSTPWFTRTFGVRTVPDLGTLTTSIQSKLDTQIVQRSWGLVGGAKLYGPNFNVEAYARTRNYFLGIVFHLCLVIAGTLLAIAPIRWLIKKFVYTPGDGPTAEETKSNRIEYRGIGYPDVSMPNPPRVYCRAYFEGCMYGLTGLILCNGAMSLLKDDVMAKKLGGGVMTPATLGQPFIDRLNISGFGFEAKILEN